MLQSALARRRAQLAAEEATARRPAAEGLLAAFDRQLPFTLTAGQAAVGKTLAAELAQDSPMNRLLQGEVGSGKTIVALRAMLQVVDAGGQAALLAPTEVLAAQHFESIRRTLGPLSRDGTAGRLRPGRGPGHAAHRLHAHRGPEAGHAGRRLRNRRDRHRHPRPAQRQRLLLRPGPDRGGRAAPLRRRTARCAPVQGQQAPAPAGHDRHPHPQDRGHDRVRRPRNVRPRRTPRRPRADHHPRRRARGTPGLGHAHLDAAPGKRSTPATRSTSSAPRSARTTTATSAPARPNRPPRTWRATTARANWRP